MLCVRFFSLTKLSSLWQDDIMNDPEIIPVADMLPSCSDYALGGHNSAGLICQEVAHRLLMLFCR